MALLLLLGAVLGAVLEIWVAVRVADLIGALPTAGLLLLSAIAGANVLRRGAPMAWRRIAEASRTGERLGRQVLDGGLIVVAGLLLLVPGLVSGVLGALLLLPPVRAVVRPGLAFLVLRRVSLPVIVGSRGAGWAANRARSGWGSPAPGRADDIEGHAAERGGDVVDGTARESVVDEPRRLDDGPR
ncbi:MAG: FxsA family protein [Patulibacter sp.]|nr:FxsA family protein [Patulibacter sp.]